MSTLPNPTLEEWRATVKPMNSARAYNALVRRVDDWLTRDYVTDAQKQALAQRILSSSRDAG